MSFVDPLLRLVRNVTGSKARAPRRAPRLPLKVTAQLRTGDKKLVVPVTLTNISVGGVSVTGRLRLRYNDPVYLTMQLSDALKFEVRARVVHAGNKIRGFQSQYGLRFFGLSQENYRLLTSFIHDRKNGWQFDVPPPPWDAEPA